VTDTQETKIQEEKVQVEDVKEESDDEMPTLEAAPKTDENKGEGGDKGGDGAGGKAKQSRTEKKSRKAIGKLGMKPVPGIMRVTVKKAKNILFVIANPDVFKSPNSDTYVIFGEAKIEDYSGEGLSDTAQKFKKEDVSDLGKEVGAGLDDEPPSLEPVDGAGSTEGEEERKGGEGGAGGAGGEEVVVSEKDIELVISQTQVSRAQAIAALKKSNGDIVGAIMQLTL